MGAHLLGAVHIYSIDGRGDEKAEEECRRDPSGRDREEFIDNQEMSAGRQVLSIENTFYLENTVYLENTCVL